MVEREKICGKACTGAVNARRNNRPEEFYSAMSNYDKEMAFLIGKFRGQEIAWNWIQKIAILFFILSLILSLVGFFNSPYFFKLF